MKRTVVALGILSLPAVLAVAAIATGPSEAGTEEALKRLDAATEKHISVLSDLLEEVPEEARPAIRESIHLSRHGRRKAHEAVAFARIKGPFRRAEFRWKQAQGRVEEMTGLEGPNSDGYAGVLAGEYGQAVQDTLAQLEQARSAGAGIDKALEKVEAGTQSHLKALEQAAARAPEQAQEALQHARESSLIGRQAALSALRVARGRGPDDVASVGPPAGIPRGKPGHTEEEDEDDDRGAGQPDPRGSGGPPAGIGRP